MKVLFLASCCDLYSYDGGIVTSHKLITKGSVPVDRYKKDYLSRLGSTTSWEYAALLDLEKPAQPKTTILWNEKVPLKTKTIINRKALELQQKTPSKNPVIEPNWIPPPNFDAGLQFQQVLAEMNAHALANLQQIEANPVNNNGGF